MPLTQAQLAQIMPNADAALWLAPLNAAMAERAIDSPQRAAAFLAQIAHESGQLRRLEERLGYSAKRLREVWPGRFPTDAVANEYAGNPQKLANRVYAGRLGNGNETSGDGWRFRRRGLIQLTGRSNYTTCKAALGIDLVATPDLLLQPAPAARSAAWFWQSRGLNELADQQPGDDDNQDFIRITRLINGGTVGLQDRLAYWTKARAALGA
jgi:putative chitinase